MKISISQQPSPSGGNTTNMAPQPGNRPAAAPMLLPAGLPTLILILCLLLLLISTSTSLSTSPSPSTQPRHLYGDLLQTRYTVDETLRVTAPIIADSARLAQNRQKLSSGDTILTEALRHLEAHAGWLLRQESPSVTDKPITRAPITPNDYVSQGLYWWPDPNSPDGLPYIRRDGQRNPENDSLDFPRMSRLISSVTSLTLAWTMTGDGRYAAKAHENLQVWFCAPDTRMNPNLRYAQGIPGRNLGRSSGIIDTYAMPELIDAIYQLRHGETWPDHMDVCLDLWFSDMLDWMLTSPHGREESHKANNHGTWYDAQVVSYAVFTGRVELAEGILREIVPRRIRSQVRRSGRMPREMARASGLDYCVYNLKAFNILAHHAGLFGIDLTEYRTWLSSGLPGAVAWLDREFERRSAGEHLRERTDWLFLQSDMKYESIILADAEVQRLIPSRFRDFLKNDVIVQ